MSGEHGTQLVIRFTDSIREGSWTFHLDPAAVCEPHGGESDLAEKLSLLRQLFTVVSTLWIIDAKTFAHKFSKFSKFILEHLHRGHSPGEEGRIIAQYFPPLLARHPVVGEHVRCCRDEHSEARQHVRFFAFRQKVLSGLTVGKFRKVTDDGFFF